MSKSDSRIYVGNLPPDIRTKDIEDLFYKYGKIKYIDLKNRKGPPFAFVEFDDSLDAEDAIKGRDNYDYEGYKLRVEFQKGSRGGAGGGRDGGGGGGGRGSRSGPPTRRSDHRCVISGLPPTGSWQDLKDHMRVAGNVCYADVFKDGTGVVEFIRYEDAKYAVKHLDDTKFRSHEGETSYVRVKMDSSRRNGGGRSASRSHSRSRSRSRSSSYSRSRRERERSSPSYSPVKKSRSRSRSEESSSENRRSKRSRRSTSRASSRSRSRSTRRNNRRSRSRSKSRSRSRSRSRAPRDASKSKSKSPLVTRRDSKSKSRSVSKEREDDAAADKIDVSEGGGVGGNSVDKEMAMAAGDVGGGDSAETAD